MARDVESLVLQMSADVRRMEKALDQGQRKFDKTADAIERRQRQLDKNLANLGREAANFAQPVQLAASVALGAIVAMSYNAAKRAEAVSGAFKQTFRDMPAEAEAAVSAISTEFGRLETDIKDNFTQLRSVLTALGVDAAQSLQIVDQLQRRSLDIAAFRDVSDADAFRAVISGITGETEPLKRFGIVVNETAVKAELLRLGFKGNTSAASEAAKSIARTNIIMRQSAEAQGQVSREASTLAEQEKRTRAEFVKAAEDLGQKFLPVAARLLKWASDALSAFNALPSGVQNAGLALLAFVAVSGPIGAAINGLRALIAAAVAALAAIMAIPAAGAAGGAAGGARAAIGGATAGAAGAVAPLAAGGTVVGLGVASFAPAPPPANAPVEQRLAYARRYQTTATTYIRQLEQEKRQKDARLSNLSSGIDSLLASGGGQIGGPGGDFGLSSGQQTATGLGGGGRSGGRGSSGPSAEDLAAQREMLRLQGELALAQATGREADARSVQRQIDLINLTKSLTDAGVADAKTAAEAQIAALSTAEDIERELDAAEEAAAIRNDRRERSMQYQIESQRQQNDALLEQIGFEAELARLSGDPVRILAAERDLFIEERINALLRDRVGLISEADRAAARGQAESEFALLDSADREGRMREEFRSSFRDGIKAAIDGDLGGFFENLADRFTSRMLDNLADDLFDLLSQAAKGFNAGGGGGGFLSSIASALSAGFGKRALGGPVSAGTPYIVGERRAEVFVPNVSGTIIPSVNAAMAKAQAAGSRGQVVDYRMTINLAGANGDETIRRIAYDAAARGGQAAYQRARADVPADMAMRRRYGRG